jgi:hypothetical protein
MPPFRAPTAIRRLPLLRGPPLRRPTRRSLLGGRLLGRGLPACGLPARRLLCRRLARGGLPTRGLPPRRLARSGLLLRCRLAPRGLPPRRLLRCRLARGGLPSTGGLASRGLLRRWLASRRLALRGGSLLCGRHRSPPSLGVRTPCASGVAVRVHSSHPTPRTARRGEGRSSGTRCEPDNRHRSASPPEMNPPSRGRTPPDRVADTVPALAMGCSDACGPRSLPEITRV